MPERVPLYLLAGGRSSRFGSDKARADAGGVPMIVRVACALSPVSSRTRVVADVAGKYDDLGLATIADAVPGCGPLGGLRTALDDLAGEPWLLVAPCDAPGLDARWVARLLARREPRVRAIAFRGVRWEPLPAVVHASARTEIDAALARGDGALHRWLEAVGAAAVPVPEGWPAAASCNTPDALARFLATTRASAR
jgi:molybdopterin-guanine dinucleotide biosynthesis protein A